MGLGVAGVLTFAIYGFDKITLVVGGMFVAMSLLSVLRQTGRISIDVESPILVILSGVLLMASRSSRVRAPVWLKN